MKRADSLFGLSRADDNKNNKRLLILFFILFLCLFSYRSDIFFIDYYLCDKGDLIGIDKFNNTTVYLYKYGDVEISEKEIDKTLAIIRNSYIDFPFYVSRFPNHKFYFDPSEKRPPEKFQVVLMDSNNYYDAFGDSYGYYLRFYGVAFIKWDGYCDNLKFGVGRIIKHETFHHLIDIYRVKTEELMAEQFELVI